MFDRIKQHVEEHKPVYVFVGSFAVGFTVTTLVRKGRASKMPEMVMTGEPAIINTVRGKYNTLNAVSIIEANRQGPPSWVVRCIETGELFTSQRAAEKTLEITAGNISKYMRGAVDSANGYTFERICLAA